MTNIIYSFQFERERERETVFIDIYVPKSSIHVKGHRPKFFSLSFNILFFNAFTKLVVKYSFFQRCCGMLSCSLAIFR
jgi:hypothetical protein